MMITLTSATTLKSCHSLTLHSCKYAKATFPHLSNSVSNNNVHDPGNYAQQSFMQYSDVSSSSSTLRPQQQQHQRQQNQPKKPIVAKHQRREFTSLNKETPFQLCFLRHGQSTWNRDNRFIGWNDTPLTDDGVLEARVAGQMLARSNIRFDEVHTSMLRRSIRTTNLVLMELGQEYIPVYKHWRLNERSYGDLVGQNKKEAVMTFGKDQVKRWRRSFDEPPPPMQDDHPFHPKRDPRYRMMIDDIPKSESLKDTLARSKVYWEEVCAPALQSGKTLLIVGHENNLRSLIMNLEDIPKEDIIELNLPRAVPLVYRLDLNTLKPLDRADGHLDEATGMLRGEWVGGDRSVSQILERDDKQVYDTTIQTNLELGESRQKWSKWMGVLAGTPNPPEAVAAAAEAEQVKPTSNDNWSNTVNGESLINGVDKHDIENKEDNKVGVANY